MSNIRTNDRGETQQQCAKCDQWFDPRGIRLHEMHCDGEAVDNGGPEPVETTTEPRDRGEELDRRICPDCDSTRIGTCSDVREEMVREINARGTYTEDEMGVLEQLANHTYICRECRELFDGGGA